MPAPPPAPPEQRDDMGLEHILERAAEQDHQALDHHHHLPGDLRNVEGQLRAALIERAEQQRRQHHAERMIAAHQRHGDADEADAAGEALQQIVMHAQDVVEADEARQRAGDQHGHDDGAGRRDAGIAGGALAMADGADLIAPAGVPDEDPDEDAAEQRQQRRQVERRAGDRRCRTSRRSPAPSGSQTSGAKSRLRGACWPGWISTSTSR